ncbi:MAG: acyl carrier protein [Thermodesulfobacteriota bacterium]
MSNAVANIREFIFENFLFDAAEEELANNTSFMEEGIIDSTGVLELVDWLEERFGIVVADDELVPENLDSVAQLSSFIASKAV